MNMWHTNLSGRLDIPHPLIFNCLSDVSDDTASGTVLRVLPPMYSISN